jgi:hypothetical protein
LIDFVNRKGEDSAYGGLYLNLEILQFAVQNS